MNYHVLTQDQDRKSVRVCFHIPIPATGTNYAGVQWREAVKKERAFSKATGSALPDIIAAEQTSIDNGEIVELLTSVQFSSVSLTDGQRKAQIDTAFTAAKAALIAEKQIVLAFIGYQADVA